MDRIFYYKLIDEINKLEEIRKRIEMELKEAPEGALWENRMQHRTTYRQYVPEQKKDYPHGKYIGKENAMLIKELAQKDYYVKTLKWTQRVDKQLKELRKCYEENNPEIIYNRLSEGRKELINPVFLPDEEYIELWKSHIKTEDNSFENDRNIFTEQGERVRSKTEKIIADKLWIERVPYVYEPNLQLSDGIRLFPDFAVLNVRTREEFYWEHFGKMDDPDYCFRTLDKIERYRKNGLEVGKNIICTFETHNRELGKSTIERLIETYLV